MSAPTFPAPAVPMRPASAAPRLPQQRRPSVRAAWRWENRKAPNRWYWPVIAILNALSLASGYAQYVSERDIFVSQGVTWEILWAQAMILGAMLFLPLTIGGFTAQMATGEHEGRNWQRMTAGRLETAMIAGKLLHGLQVGFLTSLVFFIEFAATGMLLGFDLTGLAPFLPRIVTMALAVWAIEVFVMWLGAVLKSFAAIMITVLIGVVLGFPLYMIMPPLTVLDPLALLTSASSVRSLEDISSPGSLLASSIVCLVWVGILSLALRRSVKKQS